MSSSENLLKDMISGKSMTASQQIGLTVRLSIPAILAQISSIVMQYIDASMVGRLGANASGAIGLVSSTTWLFGGLCIAVTTGFTVQIAQAVGAGEDKSARNIMKQGLIIALCISVILALIAALISSPLPRWLGCDTEDGKPVFPRVHAGTSRSADEQHSRRYAPELRKYETPRYTECHVLCDGCDF